MSKVTRIQHLSCLMKITGCQADNTSEAPINIREMEQKSRRKKF